MIDLQIINKILHTGSMQIVFEYGLGVEHFASYEKEFKFIQKFWNKYKKVPDKETFINKFPNFEFMVVSDADNYLVEGLKEEYLYGLCVPVINEVSKIVKENSFDAVNYLRKELPKLSENLYLEGVDILKQAQKRNEARKKRSDKTFFSTGFPELDLMLLGIQKGEELITLFARTNQGKSWIALKLAQAVVLAGANIVFYSGEMSDDLMGYRFDSLMKHFSNVGLIRNNLEDEAAYEKYISDLENVGAKFIVVTPKMLGGKATVSKLVSLCEKYKAEALFVDQISLMIDERSNNENTKIKYANISEDLFAFSESSGVAVILAAQANRKSVDEGDNDLPDLNGIAGADDIAHNSSKVLAIRQKDDCIEIAVRKNRNGSRGGIVRYSWNIDRGIFEFINAEDGKGSKSSVRTQHAVREVRKPKTNTEVF